MFFTLVVWYYLTVMGFPSVRLANMNMNKQQTTSLFMLTPGFSITHFHFQIKQVLVHH